MGWGAMVIVEEFAEGRDRDDIFVILVVDSFRWFNSWLRRFLIGGGLRGALGGLAIIELILDLIPLFFPFGKVRFESGACLGVVRGRLWVQEKVLVRCARFGDLTFQPSEVLFQEVDWYPRSLSFASSHR